MPGPLIGYRGYAEQRERDIGISVGAGFGAQAMLTLPAIPNQCYVFTSFTWHVFCDATPSPGFFDVTVNDGTGSSYMWWNRMVLQNLAYASDRIVLGGLNLSAAVGAAVTLQFGAAGGAHVVETISVTYFVAMGVS